MSGKSRQLRFARGVCADSWFASPFQNGCRNPFFFGGGRTIKEDSLQVGLLTDFSPQQGPKDSRTKGGLDP